jgi:hypothetical protein
VVVYKESSNLQANQPSSCCLAAAVMFAMQPPPKVLPGQAPAAATAEDAAPAPAAAPGASSPTAAAAGPQPSSPSSALSPRAAAAAASAVTEGAGTSGDTGDTQVTPVTPPAANPLVLLLDVVLEAPVIVMPLASSSQDHMEVDLGTLEVSNRVMWEVKGQGAGRQRLLLDQLQVGGGGPARVVREGRRGGGEAKLFPWAGGSCGGERGDLPWLVLHGLLR